MTKPTYTPATDLTDAMYDYEGTEWHIQVTPEGHVPVREFWVDGALRFEFFEPMLDFLARAFVTVKIEEGYGSEN